MPAPPTLIDALDQQTLFEALERLYQARYTGRVILHFDNGLPHALDLTTTHRATLTRWPPKTAPQAVSGVEGRASVNESVL